jgi:ubiquinone/menaquinone biosynthesis C-methylase UbiE
MRRDQPKSQAHSEDHLVESRKYWWNDDYLDLLAQRLELDQCTALADIGCGKGMMAFKLAPHLPEGARVFGLDIEPRYIRAAKRQAKKRAELPVSFEFQTGTAYEIPLEDAQLDLAVCQTLLIHLERPRAAIAEMMRVVRPGGWLVAMEPNNLVPNLMFDRYVETDYDIEDVLELVAFRLRCEKGKKALGEGFSSLGDVVPDLFSQAGLEDIHVWLSDKAMPIIPPYETREMRIRVAQLITWLESGDGGFGYEENLRYYLAGGGSRAEFDLYWQRLALYKIALLQKLKEGTFISAGGSMMYIVAARKPEA